MTDADDDDKTPRRESGVQSVRRAIGLLNTVMTCPDGIGVRELSRRVGLKPSTAHALIKSLVQLHYLEHCPENRKYRLGIGALMLGFGAGTSWHARISGAVHDLLVQLAVDGDETALLFGFFNGLVTCLDCIDRPHELNVRLEPGIFLKLPHRASFGKLLLAHAPAAFLQDYVRAQEASHELGPEYQSSREFLVDLQRIKEQGYSEICNLSNSGIYSLSYPVQSFSGVTSLAVGFSLPVSRLTKERKELLHRLLAKTAIHMAKRYARFQEPEELSPLE